MANKDLQRANIQGAAKTTENSQGKANANAQNKTNSQGNAKAQIHGETSIKAQTKAEIHANSQTSPKAENIAQNAAKTTKNASENLLKARKGKNDEFYTQLSDIENELFQYINKDKGKNPFENKVVYCNCDDPKVSNFFLFFAYNFWYLGLKKVICSCYKNTDPAKRSKHDNEKGCFFEYEGKNGGGGGRALEQKDDIDNFIKNELKSKEFQGNGDFRSKESINLLKQADIVVTNPPFSLFREYVAQLMEVKNNKGENLKFIIVGNQNNITYKDIFRFIKEKRLWLGSSLSYAAFKVPSYYEERSNRFWIDESGQKWRSFGNITWFANLHIAKERNKFNTIARYSKTPEKYPKYDNYDAINIDKSIDIPMDYEGAMGVPITFLNKYDPEQFEILGLDNHLLNDGLGKGCNSINGKKIYRRLIIKNNFPKKD